MDVKLRDIAERAGCSIGAASKAMSPDGTAKIRISEATRLKVLKVAAELDYHPNLAARQLAGKRSGLVGVLVSMGAAPIQLARVELIENMACLLGYQTMVGRFPFQRNPDELRSFIMRLAGRGIEGLIVIGDLVENEAKYGALDAYGILPTVHIAHPEKAIAGKCGLVAVDVRGGTRGIVDFILRKGYARPGCAMSKQRHELFKEVAAEKGGVGTKVKTWLLDKAMTQKLDALQAKDIVDTLVLKGKADVIVAANDYWAASINQELRRRNIDVPGDVGLIGYNNLDFAEFLSPPLTTVDEDNNGIAEQSVKLLVKLLSAEAPPALAMRVNVIHKLVERESA